MQALSYARVHSVDEAVRVLQEHGPTARVLAGGTDLIVQARGRRVDVDLLVDIKSVPEMQQLAFDPSAGLTVGASTPCYRIYRDPAVRQHYPGLVDCTILIGGTGIQGRASLGGNLCNSSPSGDTIPALYVLEAVAHIAGPSGERDVPVEEFCTGPGRNVLQPGEFVVTLHFPAPVPQSGTQFLRFIPRNEMDIAVANAAAQVRLDGDNVTWARVAIGAVAPTVLLVGESAAALVGRPISDASLAAAGAAARAAARPIDDMRGTIKQRKHLSDVLTQRALRGAIARARGETL